MIYRNKTYNNIDIKDFSILITYIASGGANRRVSTLHTFNTFVKKT